MEPPVAPKKARTGLVVDIVKLIMIRVWNDSKFLTSLLAHLIFAQREVLLR